MVSDTTPFPDNYIELEQSRWTPSQAWEWHQRMPWLVGANFVPSTASNQLEMWQADTFDAATIDRELGWAESLGMTSMRVFLHDLPWHQDRHGFLDRITCFLDLADTHGIGAMFVLFDSCWHPFPRVGRQREPELHTHNSCWVQSPGVDILRSPARFAALEDYVTGIVSHFADDPRVHVWDLWNEPDNENTNAYGMRDLPGCKGDIVLPLMAQATGWVRQTAPSQPLTIGVWTGDWSPQHITPFHRFQLDVSDVISFHRYADAHATQADIDLLRAHGRPLLCTEYMARGAGSTFDAILPVFCKESVGAYNWGFVAGRSQTQYPWDSWNRAYDAPPELWFHDIFHPSGEPYLANEVAVIRRITGAGR